MKRKRLLGLKIIVTYKTALALLLALTASILLLALENHSRLIAFSENFILDGTSAPIEAMVENFLLQQPQTLKYSGLVAGIYALVTTVEAIGLWYEKVWGGALVLILVGMSIPPEIYELIHRFTTLKLGIFLVNIAIFGYLLRFLHHPLGSYHS
jgi:uncharacterized membrane protein (DUF2068 family)